MELAAKPSRKTERFHEISASDVVSKVDSTVRGLSSEEAERRLAKLGPNLLPLKQPRHLTLVFLRQFLNPLIYVLLAVGTLSLFIGHESDALFVFGILVLNAFIGTFQEYSAEKSALALRQTAKTQARVKRDDEITDVDSSRLVVGDLVVLESGDKVPADLRLLSSNGLRVDESLLTGESLPVLKDASSCLTHETPIGDRVNLAFAGTLVTHGRATGVVVGTALETELGKIARTVMGRATIKTPLLIRMEKFSRWVAILLAIVIVVLGTLMVLQGTALMDVVVFSIALGVSAIPEGLPIALTVALSIASRRMSKRNVIVRRLAAVEALGSCTYIGTDKTGTLTVNELTAKVLAIPDHLTFDVEGAGLNPQGEIRIPEDVPSRVAKRGIGNLCRAVVLCNEASLREREGQWVGLGDAVDVALLVLAKKAGLTAAFIQSSFQLLDQIPFESEQKFAATLHATDERARDRQTERSDHRIHLISVKGALETVLPMCSSVRVENGLQSIDSSMIERTATDLARSGFRVLAVAQAERDETSRSRLESSDLNNLEFLGLVGMIDPLRSDAGEAVRASLRAGIHVTMITGDHPETALAIARELELAEDIRDVMTGKELRTFVQEKKGRLEDLTGVRVFARVEPDQKLWIVESLQKLGHFIAVTGDGANDAPALKAANVGIAMGKSGTDVARETADLVLADDKFSSIVGGIEEGRIAYSNVRKVIYLLISTGAAEVVLFILSILMGLPAPLTAIQLLWLNIVTNGIQDKALAFEPGEGDELRRKPRSPQEPIFDRLMIERVLLSAMTTAGVTFFYYWQLHSAGMAHAAAQNLVLLQMVLFENVLVGNARSETKSILRMNPFRNALLLFGTIAAQLVHIGSMYVPWLREVLGVRPVTFAEWTLGLALALSVFFVIEIHKWIFDRSSHSGLGVPA